ncbi:hypothetical protein [Novosphingobium sp. JCM 18896]|uniref:hypothetical protein n=1 Tax=Novosphingobium sp. JCM 18896 TaxID=2989731 RepID=UPI002221A991|nr:hypothetical protein [Novosphingobium sp. JCM 18896]MCW1432226.1 hypothetical protein [Novosphingobium sp. JCM 18896]
MDKWIIEADIYRLQRSLSDSPAAAQKAVLEGLLKRKRDRLAQFHDPHTGH